MVFKNLLVHIDDTKACDRRVAAAVARQFREVLDGHEESEAGDKHLNEPVPIASFSNGNYYRDEGAALVAAGQAKAE